jgi:hypothetical protein
MYNPHWWQSIFKKNMVLTWWRDHDDFVPIPSSFIQFIPSPPISTLPDRVTKLMMQWILAEKRLAQAQAGKGSTEIYRKSKKG